MKNALVIEQSDIKALIAEKYCVDEKSVIKTQYSYIVLIGEETAERESAGSKKCVNASVAENGKQHT